MNINELVDLFRYQLLNREVKASAKMVRLYGSIALQMERNGKALMDKIEKQRRAGVTVSPSLLFQEGRLQELKRQVAGELSQFADTTTEQVTNLQRKVLEEVPEQTLKLTKASLGKAPSSAIDAVTTSWTDLPTQAIEALVGRASDGSPLRSLFLEIAPAAADRFELTLVNAVAQGLHPSETARQLRDGFGIGLNRALNIARTETISAYREGTRQVYKQNPEVLDGWIWHSALGPHTCPACFVSGTVVSGPMVEATTSRFWVGEIVKLKFASGIEFELTPNHPILTPKGWIAAGLLNEGDDVIGCSDCESAILQVEPNQHQVPTLIEDVSKTLGFKRSIRLPVSPEHFHGDGDGSKVCIVRTNSLLWNSLDTSLRKQTGNERFSGANPRSSFLSGFSRLKFGPVKMARSIAFTTQRNVGALKLQSDGASVNTIHSADRFSAFTGDVSVNHIIRQASPRCSVGSILSLPLVTLGFLAPEPKSAKFSLKRSITGMVPARDVVTTLSGQVFTDCVLKISRRAFSGQVYSLQTSQGWHFATSQLYPNKGIVSSNCWAMHGTFHSADETLDGHPRCRCAMVPIAKSWEALGFTGLPDTRPNIPKGAVVFREASAAIQESVLGAKGYALYREGKVDLVDFLARKNDARWGTMRYARSVRQIALKGGGFQIGPEAVGAFVPPKAAVLPVNQTLPTVTKKLHVKTFKSDEEMYAWGLKSFEPLEHTATELEKKAIRDYTGMGFTSVNKSLRTGEGLSGIYADISSGLDAMFAKPEASIPETIKTYRGFNTPELDRLSKAEVVGTVLEDLGYVSTSLDKVIEEGFVVEEGDALMEITVPRGAKAAYLGSVSSHAEEAELLLPRGTKLKINGIVFRKIDNLKRKIYQVEVISE